jgi:phage recombination protein Bet
MEATSVTALATRAPEWSEDQRALIKRTVAPEATNDELAMFLHVAKKAGLDPLQKQIWFVKRRQKVTKNGREEWEDRVTIQAGVDGLQARALRMPDCEGIQAAVVYAKDDFVFDKAKGEVLRHQGNPFGAQGEIVGAWAIVRRAGKTPFVALIRFSEYVDDRSFLWKNKPSVMIEKVARSTALRRAYPEDFGGIYDPAEMGKDAAPEAMRAIDGEVIEPKPEPAPALPPAGKVEAPPPAAARTVEAQPQRPATPPPHVMALWNEVKAAKGETRTSHKTRAAFEDGAKAVWGDKPKPSEQWTPEETAKVREHILGPDDIRF